MWNCNSRNMTNKNLFINALFLAIAIIFSAISQCSSVLSDKRLCYDLNCSEPVSLARTTIRYSGNEPGLLSFDINVKVTVYSKEAGNRKDLWGVEINGKHGYVSKTFLKEYKVLHRNLLYEVPIDPLFNNVPFPKKPQPKKDEHKSTFDTKDTKTPNEQIDSLSIKSTEELPHSITGVSSSYEVIDGTTVHLDEKELSIEPTSVKESVQTTVVPNKQDAVDNPKHSFDNGKTESPIFIEHDKISKEIEDEKQADSANIKDFVTSSEEVLDVPESGTHVTPLNISIVSSLDETENVEGNSSTEVKDQSLEETVDIKVPQIPISDDAKEALNTERDTVVELHKKENISLTETETHDSKSNKLKNTETTYPIEIQDATIKLAGNDEIKSNVQTAGVINKTETLNADIKLDTQSLETSRATDTKNIQSSDSDTIVSNKIESKIQHIENSDKVEIEKTRSLKNAIIDDNKDFVTSSEEVLDVPESGTHVTPLNISIVSSLDETENVEGNSSTEVKDQSLEETVDIKVPQIPISDDAKEALNTERDTVVELHKKENISLTETETHDSKSNKLKNTETTYPIEIQDATIKLAGNDEIKSNVQTAGVINKTETLNADIKLDTQSLETSRTTDTKNIQSSDSDTIVSNKIESKIQHIENSDKVEIEKTQSLKNAIIDANSDSTLNVESIETVDKVITENVSSIENTVVPTNDTGPDIQNLENSKDVNAKDIPFFKSVTTDTESVMNELKKQETKSTEDINEHSNNEYVSPLFLDLHVKDEIPMILSSSDTGAPPQMIENTSEFDTKNVPPDSNIMDAIFSSDRTVEPNLPTDDTILAKETPSDTQYDSKIENTVAIKETISESNFLETSDLAPQELPPVCTVDNIECFSENIFQNSHHEQASQDNENAIMNGIQIESNYWQTLIYLSITAAATLIFSLGYYCIENMRRDRQLIARINKLEKDLLISEAECTMMNENWKSVKEKLSRMEDESFGSDEMVLSLRADLEASQNAKVELEEQVAMLEKDLESATEAGLELEKMLREVLSTNNEVNPLAQSVEDLQTRLNAQQTANESLTNALNLKTQENEALSVELASVKKKCEELKVELTRISENLKEEVNSKNSIERTLTDRVQQLEMQMKEISIEKATLQKELKGKEMEVKDLADVINRLNSNNLDLDKLYDVSRIKAEATTLYDERNELKVRLAEVEGAHNLLEEHVKIVKEEMAALSEQCKVAEKEKKDAETRLEVLTHFFEEKEAQRQKEEAIWLQQQGEVISTVERIQTMQNEIQNYKQQIEMLKREILDQEREYKNQISVLETKAHEQWVIARQVERRLEESKVEAGQLRNRLTLIEKNINDVDSEAKLHRVEANGETATSPPLFLGAESSSSPIMFSGSSTVPPPPPPSYLHSLFPPYLPPPLPSTSGVPPYEVSQRPPPLGGRLSSPPPMPLHPPASNRSPPPSFASDMHPPPPPPPGLILPPPLGTPHSWGEESLPPPRNSGFYPAQRERVRNHKGFAHSLGESLDKLHHNSKV